MTDKAKISIRFWKSLFTLTDLMRSRTIEHRKFVRSSNLTLQQLRLLRVVERETRLHSPEGIMLKTIAQALEVTPAAVSGMVDCMVKHEILERIQDVSDRRSVRIRLSAKCRSHVSELEGQLDDVAVKMGECIGEERFDNLASELEYMVSRFDDAVPDKENGVKNE